MLRATEKWTAPAHSTWPGFEQTTRMAAAEVYITYVIGLAASSFQRGIAAVHPFIIRSSRPSSAHGKVRHREARTSQSDSRDGVPCARDCACIEIGATVLRFHRAHPAS